MDPDVVHRSVRLDQPTATPILSLTPKRSQWEPVLAMHLVIVFVEPTYSSGGFLALPPITPCSLRGPVHVGHNASRQKGATICSNTEEAVHRNMVV